MSIVRDGKSLAGGFRDGKGLKAVYYGTELLWTTALPAEFAAVNGTSALGTASFLHTSPPGRVLVFAGIYSNANVTSATYAGQPMTQVGVVNNDDNDLSMGRLFVYEIDGTQSNGQVSLQTSGFGWVIVAAVTITEAGAVSIISSTNGAGDELLHGPVAPVPGGLVVQAFYMQGFGMIELSDLIGGTNRYNQDTGGGSTALAISTSDEIATFSATADTTTTPRWSGIAVSVEPANPPILPAAPPPVTGLVGSTLDTLSVAASGQPSGIGPITGWNFYVNDVKDNATPVAFPEWTFGGLASGTQYELYATAVDADGNEAAYPSVTASTLTDTAMPSGDRAQVDSIVNAAIASHNLPGAMVSIRGPVGDYDQAYGNSQFRAGTIPMDLGMHFRMFSVTKSFTATAILQQLDANALSLSDTVDQYVTGVPNGDSITIEHLLMMRAGLPSYDTGSIATRFYLNGTLSYDENDALADIRAMTPQFAPGTDYLYSNSNYILLGFILESVTGQGIRTVLADVITQAGLSNTSWQTPAHDNNYYPPNPYSEGWMTGIFGGQNERTRMNPDFLGAAGGLVCTITDLREWAEALRDGSLTAPATHALRESTFGDVPYAMEPGPDAFGYGYGLIKFGDWYGHDGSFPGYECATFYHKPSGTVVAAMANFQTSSLSAFSDIFANIAEYLYPGSAD